MATTGHNAPNARGNGTRKTIAASPSRSKTKEQSGSATTADGAAGLSKAAIAYAKERGISRETLERLGAASGTTFFPRRLDAKSEAIFFPYVLDGEVVNYKACAFPEKDFIGKKGGKLCFHGIDDVLAAEPGDVWIVEGEWDKASLIEAGLPIERVLSVPNGAREKKGEDNSDQPSGYAYALDALAKGLGKHTRFIWCGDSDDAGHALRQDMARILGQARFWYMEWPEGCKDANDLLCTDGPEAVRELVTDGILLWPVAGLHISDALPEPAPIEIWRVPHMPGWRDKIALAPGMMSLVIGNPGHGKTALWAQIWHDIAQANDLVVVVASFETRVKPHFRRRLRSLQTSKYERDMDDGELSAADQWIRDHYRWIVHPEQRPTLNFLLDMAEVAVVRDGAKVVQIDPWNRLESQKDKYETETDYIGRCLTAMHVFAVDMNVHLQVLAHPAKTEGNRRNRAPDLEDTAGSRHFENRVDQGFIVHRPKMFDGTEARNEAQFYHAKTRFEELGRPCMLRIKYDWRVHRFVEIDKEDAK